MARDPQQLRKTYESKLGKDLVAKLTDQQINIISKFYNSLGKEEQSEIDSKIFKGYNDSELHEMAKSFVEENSEDTKKYEPADKFIDDTQERLDGELRGTSDGILSEIDKLIAEYQGKVDSVKKSSTKLKENVKEKSSALAVIVGNVPQKEEELVDEDIDSRILELLGIEDTTGLDYSDYKSLLVEKMTADRMSDNEGDGGDSELLNNEYKRIKGSTGKFKVNSKKINAQSFVAKTKPSSSVKKVTPLLPSVTPQETEQPIQPERQGMDETLALIASKLNSVDKNVQQTTSNLQNKDAAENAQKNQDRLTTENTAAQRKEERIERADVLGGIYAGVQKTVKPLTDMMGGLFDFFQRLGFAMFIMELLKFLQDPQKYINGVIEWINRQIVKLENSIENFVISTLVKPLNNAINGINDQFSKFIGTVNPILEKLNFLGIDTQIPELKIKEIPESSIRDNFNIPLIPLLGETSPSPSESGTTQLESQPQETLMGQPSSQSGEKTSGGITAERNAAAFLSTLEGSGAQNAADAFQVMLNRTADAQAGGYFEKYGTTLGDQAMGREQFTPFSAAIYGASQDKKAQAKYGHITKELGDSPEERKKRLLEIAGQPDGMQQLEQLFNAGSATIGEEVLNDFITKGSLSQTSAKDIGPMVSFRGYQSGAGDFNRGTGGNFFFDRRSKTGSLDDVSPLPIVPTTTTEPTRKSDPNKKADEGNYDIEGNEVPIGSLVGQLPPTKVEPVSGSQSQNPVINPPVNATFIGIGGPAGDSKVPGTALAAAGGSQSQVVSFLAINLADLSVYSTMNTLGVVV